MTNSLETMKAVLQPRPAPRVRAVKPAAVADGSLQAQLIERAAQTVRNIYVDGQRRVKYDEARPEVFFDACFETFQAALEVEDAAPDDLTASIAAAVFERAGWSSTLRPTTLEAQVRMQVAAMDAARQARGFFAKQAALV